MNTQHNTPAYPEFWDKAYTEGRDYRQMDEVVLDALIRDERLGGRALDIACGTGDLAVKLARRGFSVVGVDFSPVAIDKAIARAQEAGADVKFIVGDLSAIRDQFDIIFCKLAYAFMPDKRAFLEEVKKRLNPNGAFILITPILNDTNRVTEPKPGICASEDDIAKIGEVFSRVKEYKTEYGEYGRIIKTFVCRE